MTQNMGRAQIGVMGRVQIGPARTLDCIFQETHAGSTILQNNAFLMFFELLASSASRSYYDPPHSQVKLMVWKASYAFLLFNLDQYVFLFAGGSGCPDAEGTLRVRLPLPGL